MTSTHLAKSAATQSAALQKHMDKRKAESDKRAAESVRLRAVVDRQRVRQKNLFEQRDRRLGMIKKWTEIVSGTVSRSPMEQHLLVQQGVPTAFLQVVARSYSVLSEEEVLRAVGISGRTILRRKEGKLNKEHSGATLNLIEVTEMASKVLGSRAAAENWLHEAALALDGRKPMELLSTGPGANLVKDQLTRMEYGVYA